MCCGSRYTPRCVNGMPLVKLFDTLRLGADMILIETVNRRGGFVLDVAIERLRFEYGNNPFLINFKLAEGAYSTQRIAGDCHLKTPCVFQPLRSKDPVYDIPCDDDLVTDTS